VLRPLKERSAAPTLSKLAENLAAHSAFRGWKIRYEPTVQPYCALYADFEVMTLVDDLRKNKKPLPAEDLLIGDNKSLDDMEKSYYRQNPHARKHRDQEKQGDDVGVNDDW
jgi:hypothetical protein